MAAEVEWEASMPGAGAQRVTAITQLYFRMSGYTPLTVLVADALTIVFGADGATAEELVDYLGLSEDRVLSGYESIPVDMRCTSSQLVIHEVAGDDGPTQGEGLRLYLNYKRILPAAYGHVTRILLALCVSPLPDSSYTHQVREAAMKGLTRSRSSNTAPTLFMRVEEATNPQSSEQQRQQGPSTTSTAVSEGARVQNLSEQLRKREALDGIFCRSCRFYSVLPEFETGLSRCPTCGSDVLRGLLDAITAKLRRSCLTGESLAMPLPPPSSSPSSFRPGKRQRAAASSKVTEPASPVTASTSTLSAPETHGGALPDMEGLQCALARDPFLVQQARAFMYLYSTPFACVNDAHCVVNVEEMLTEPEYERRLQGRATVADRFRAAHRNASLVHAKLISQEAVEAANLEESTRKIAKRANLPPWLQHTTTVASLLRPDTETGDGSRLTALFDGDRIGDGQKASVASSAKTSTNPTNSAGDHRTKKRHAANDGLLAPARFISAFFYESEFDEVPLPSQRR